MEAMATAEAPQIEEQVEEVVEFESIENLEALGINKGDIKKAREAGFFTCDRLLMETKKTLCEIKGLSEAKIDKMVDAARKLSSKARFTTAAEYDQQREREIVHISTGSNALDELLAGGVESKAITEIYGEYRCGKTQMCHTMCVTSQINQKNPGKAAYIDTEGAFRPERIKAIAARFGLPEDTVLENVSYVRVYTYEQQSEVLDALAALMSENQYKIVIMDSIMGCFRTDFSGRGELADRQQKLGQLLRKLQKLADEFNVAVFVTNQVMSDPSGGAMFVSDPKKATGGHVMAHASHFRLSVRKGKGEQRLLKVVQAPSLPEAEASFAISNEGIVDFKD